MKNLTLIEQVETEKDKPKRPIVIEDTSVFVDPFQEADEKLAQMREEDRINAEDQKRTLVKKEEQKVYRSGVGKYVVASSEEKKSSANQDQEQAVNSYLESYKKKSKLKISGFSNW